MLPLDSTQQAQVVSVLAYIRTLANAYTRRHPVFSFDDYVSLGCLALCESIHRWDPNRGALSTFTRLCVRTKYHEAIRYHHTGSTGHGKKAAESVRFTTLPEDDGHGALGKREATEELIDVKRTAQANGWTADDVRRQAFKSYTANGPGRPKHPPQLVRNCLEEIMQGGDRWTTTILLWELRIRVGIEITRQALLPHLRAIGATQPVRGNWQLL